MPGHHDLRRRVVVGDDQRADRSGTRFQQRVHLVGAGDDRQHRAVLALAGLGHQDTAHTRGLDQPLNRDDAGRGKRGNLTEAVPGSCVGGDAEDIEQGQLGKAGRRDRRLGVVHRGEFGLLRVRGRGVEGGLGEHDPVQIREITVEAVPYGDGVGEFHGQVRAHSDVLAALTGEQECGLSRARGAEAHRDVRILQRRGGTVGQRRAQLLRQCLQRPGVGRHESGARGTGRVEILGRLEGDAGQRLPRSRRGDDVAGPLLQVCVVVGAEHHQLGRKRPEPLGTVLAAVLLQRDMEVASAEPERADRGAPRLLPRADPRSRLRVDVERGLVQPQRGVRAIHLDRAGKRRMLQCENGLDQTGGAGSGLGVTDLGLHRTQRGPRRLPGEHRLETGELGDVTCLRRGAVRLDEFDGVRRVAGMLVCPAQRLRLSFRARCVHARGASVRRRTEPADHGENLVAVAFGVSEPLEGHHAHTLADDRAVRGVRERPAVARLGERGRLGEAHVHHHVVERVHTAGQHQVGLVQIQPVQRALQRRQRARARGVDDEVAATQIQPVGDAPSDHVAEQAGERALDPGRVMIGDVLADLVGFVFGKSVLQQRLAPDRALHARTHLHDEFGRGCDAEHDVHPVEVGLDVGAHRLVEGLSGRDQGEQLCRIGRGQRVGR